LDEVLVVGFSPAEDPVQTPIDDSDEAIVEELRSTAIAPREGANNLIVRRFRRSGSGLGGDELEGDVSTPH
jgi:hypothetical protein